MEPANTSGGSDTLRPRGHRLAGYTLMEMMAVLAIVSVMVALGVASLAPVRDRTGARRGAEEVQQALQTARKRAIASGRCHRVDLADRLGAVVAAGAPGTFVRVRRYLRAGCDFPPPPASPQPSDADFDATDSSRLPDGVAARVVPSPEVLDFLPSGRPKLGPGETRLRLAVTYLEQQFLVDVSPAGAVCVQSAAGTEPCP